MKKIIPVLLIIAVAAVLAAGCSFGESPSESASPSSETPEQTSRLLRVEVNVLGETGAFPIDDAGKLRSDLEVKSEDGKLILSTDYGAMLLDKDKKPLRTIALTEEENPPPPPDSVDFIGKVYRITPMGATFSPFLAISIGYGGEKRPPGVSASSFYVGQYTDEGWEKIRYKNTDTAASSIETRVQESMLFAILAEKSPVTTSLPRTGTEVGSLAPNFTFSLSKGQNTSLRAMQGKPVMLNFWATWCQPCLIEIPFLQQVYKDKAADGLVVLAVNNGETEAKTQAFINTTKMSLPVVYDADRSISRQYVKWGIPVTYYIDKSGIIKKIKIGAYLRKSDIDADIATIMP